MTITSIELAASSIGVDVVMQRTTDSSLTVNGVICQDVFGVDSTGQPYYETDGPPTVGEAAALGWDGSIAELFLDSRENPDPHLMLLAGPLRRQPPVTVLVRDTGQSERAAARSRSAARPNGSAMLPGGQELDDNQRLRALARAR